MFLGLGAMAGMRGLSDFLGYLIKEIKFNYSLCFEKWGMQRIAHNPRPSTLKRKTPSVKSVDNLRKSKYSKVS